MRSIIVARTPNQVATDLLADARTAAQDSSGDITGLIEYVSIGIVGLVDALRAAGADQAVQDIATEHVRDIISELDDVALRADQVHAYLEHATDDVASELIEQRTETRDTVLDLLAVADDPDRLADRVGPTDLIVYGPTIAALRAVLDVVEHPET